MAAAGTVCCSQLLGEVARGTDGAGASRDCIAEGGVAMAGDSEGISGSKSPPADIPGFASNTSASARGVGDLVMRVTHGVGIQPCAGCYRRAAALNRLLPFSKK